MRRTALNPEFAVRLLLFKIETDSNVESDRESSSLQSLTFKSRDMFFTIPVNDKQIITTTPIGARSITHVFFENKNDGVFAYKRDIDIITISIDGKMICRQVPIMPFCTSTPHGENQNHWEDKALEVNLNVNISEIKISASNVNDYNIVFVYSDKTIDQSKGIDFVEYKRIELKRVLTYNEALALYKEKFDEYTPLFEKLINKTITDDEYDKLMYEEGVVAQCGPGFGVPGMNVTRVHYRYALPIMFNPDSGNAVRYWIDIFAEKRQAGTSTWIHFIYGDPNNHTPQSALEMSRAYFIQNSSAEYILIEWNKDINVTLDRAPQKMFVCQLASKSRATEDYLPLYFNDIQLNMTLQGIEKQELPSRFDTSLIECTANKPWRNVVYEFDNEMPRSFAVTLDINKQVILGNKNLKTETSMLSERPYTKNGKPYTWDVYAIFIYKKLI